MQPHLEDAVYVNNLGSGGPAGIHAAYGPNYQLLSELKSHHDSTNVFRLIPSPEPRLVEVPPVRGDDQEYRSGADGQPGNDRPRRPRPQRRKPRSPYQPDTGEQQQQKPDLG